MKFGETFYNCNLNAVGLILVLIIFIYGRLNGKDHKEQVYFDALLISNIFLNITDTLTWCLDGATSSFARVAFPLVQVLCYFSSATIILTWSLYCEWRLHGVKRSRIRMICYWSYFGAYFLALIGNQFYPIFYHIDTNNVYHRDAFYIVYICYNGFSLLNTIILAFLAARKKNPVGKRDAYSLMLFAVPPLLGAIVQFSQYGISTLPVSLAISLLFIFVHRLFGLITMDNLTGLNNRRAFERNLETRIQNCDDKELLYLIVMDANDFKYINDNFGHKVGDDALTRISFALKKSCHHGDILARLGGDEFVILGKRKNEGEIKAFCNEIRGMVENENSREGYEYNLSLSVGYAVYDYKKNEQATSFFERADEAMYSDKATYRKMKRKITRR